MIGNLLNRLQSTELMQHPEMRNPVEQLEEILRHTYMLILSCQDSSYLQSCFMGGKQAHQLRDVQSDITFYLQLFPLVSFVDTTRTWERLLSRPHPFCTEMSYKKYIIQSMELGEELPLDWSKRSQIVKGIAEGAVYLHKQCEPRIIHGDLKPGNILLDAALNPRFVTLVHRKHLGQDMDCTGIVVGSRGYMAPEYKQGGCVSLKTDVYSFAATLLEIIRGSRIPPSSLELYDESRDFGPLNKWAWELWRGGNLMEFIDPSLRGETHSAAEIQRWVQIALLCVQRGPEERPDMCDVVLMLSSDSTVILPKPSRPAYY
uniref:Protein kinase domain-containing protein n=1 Tax=Oryza punctata TaxID=4537 RepID=A0A0E0MI11_ORYPU